MKTCELFIPDPDGGFELLIFAPDGLYLTGVSYAASWGLPATQYALSTL